MMLKNHNPSANIIDNYTCGLSLLSVERLVSLSHDYDTAVRSLKFQDILMESFNNLPRRAHDKIILLMKILQHALNTHLSLLGQF